GIPMNRPSVGRTSLHIWRNRPLLVLAAAGALLATMVVLAPVVGLGENENFVLYRWFAIPRRTGVVVALSTVGVAVLLSPMVERSLRILFAGSRRLLAGLRRQWAAILVTAISTSVALVMLEATMRLVDGVPLFSSENFVSRLIDHVHHTLSIYDPLLGWVLANNSDAP